MHRQDLLGKLAAYRPVDDEDARTCRAITDFVRANPACFERTHAAGHITGASWLLDASGRRVLLTHHRKLRRWLQLGGHADGNPDVIDVALREAREESGIDTIALLSEEIFDIDVHLVPAIGAESAHYHYDICFLMQVTGTDRFTAGSESIELAWFSEDQLSSMITDESVMRKRRKWLLANAAAGVRSE